MWTCACGVENGQRARSCESCGAERVGEAKGQPSVTGCEWQSFGTRRCLMPGSASLDGKRWLCSWHLDGLRSPRTVDDWDEFGRWIAAMLEAAVCCEWTHWGTEPLWAAVRGLRALSGYRQPCRQPLCPHRETEPWQGTPAEAIARIRRDLARIGTVTKPATPIIRATEALTGATR